jgi:cytolysin-activating lysine-acyltransferase
MKKPTKKSASPTQKTTTPPPETQKQQQDILLRRVASQKINVAFAQVVTLMMRHQAYRNHFIAELEWMVVPPIALGQFLVTEIEDKGQGVPVPVATVLWARVSKDVDARLTKLKTRPKLSPGEWNSGDIPWLVDAFGDPRQTSLLIKHVAEKIFPRQGLKAVQHQPDGSTIVRQLGRQPS